MNININKQKFAIIIASAVGALSIFLPWFNVPFAGSINATSAWWGWMVFLLFIVPIVACLQRNKLEELKGIYFLTSVSTTIICTFIGIIKAIAFYSMKSGLSDNLFSASTSIGIGLGLCILAGAAATISAYYFRDDKFNISMHKQKKAIIIVSSVGILSVFLPWISTSNYTITGMDIKNEWVVLILFAIPIIVCLLKETKEELKTNYLFWVVVPPAIALAMGIIKAFDIVDASVGVGLIIFLLSAISIPVLAFVLGHKK